MVDLMMWLVIAALLLATALQGIGYYQKNAYLYSMKNDASNAAEAVMAKVSSVDGRITDTIVAAATTDSTKTTNVTTISENGSDDIDGFVIRSSSPSVPDKDVLFLSAQRGDYGPGIHVVPKDTVIAADGATTVVPGVSSGGTGEETATPAVQPTIDTTNVMTTVWDTNLTFDHDWNTSTAGLSCTNITLPINGDVDVTINWGDGTPDSVVKGSYDDTTPSAFPSHTFATPGVHEVTITGTFTTWVYGYFDWTRGCLKEVTSWGDGTGTISVENGFYGADNLTDIARIPNTVTHVGAMLPIDPDAAFVGNSLAKWDTSNVTSMRGLFWDVHKFSGDVSNWNTSKVTDMGYLFHRSTLNLDVSKWDTSSVTKMDYTFFVSSFTGDLSEWNVSNVKTMEGMFQGSVFNGDISKWNVSNVENMHQMFSESSFNSPIGEWQTLSLKNLSNMFSYSPFNQNISEWNTSQVEQMYGVFAYSPFNQDISGWDTSKAITMNGMFQNATAFNQNISGWKTPSLLYINSMFEGATSFNQDIGDWDVSNVSTFMYVFKNATTFNQDLTGWQPKVGAWAYEFDTNSGLSPANRPTFR